MDFTDLSSKAINSALNDEWQEAVLYNKEILKHDPKNIEALSRIAKAYLELKNNKMAIKFYRQVLKADRFNPIAKRALERLKDLKTSSPKKYETSNEQVKTDFFLEESGKTKTITLVRLGEAKVLLELDVADIVVLKPKKHSIGVYDQQNRYLGRFPDDLSSRLVKLINTGNKYAAAVKYVDKKNLQIFIRELTQGKKNINTPSFPSKGTSYHAFLSLTAIPEEPPETEEEES